MIDIYIGILCLISGIGFLINAIRMDTKHAVGRVGQLQGIVAGIILIALGITFLLGIVNYDESKPRKNKTEIYILSNYFNKC